MDPLTQRLVVAQDLVNGLLALVPPNQHAAAQQILTQAAAKLKLIDAQTQPPLVAPQLVPAAAAQPKPQ